MFEDYKIFKESLKCSKFNLIIPSPHTQKKNSYKNIRRCASKFVLLLLEEFMLHFGRLIGVTIDQVFIEFSTRTHAQIITGINMHWKLRKKKAESTRIKDLYKITQK